MTEQVFKYRNIKMAIYSLYGKLQKREARKECHSYIDQVKGGLFLYIWQS